MCVRSLLLSMFLTKLSIFLKSVREKVFIERPIIGKILQNDILILILGPKRT